MTLLQFWFTTILITSFEHVQSLWSGSVVFLNHWCDNIFGWFVNPLYRFPDFCILLDSTRIQLQVFVLTTGLDKNFPHKSIFTITINFNCLVLSWLDHKFDLPQRSFSYIGALKRLSKTKFSLEWQKEGVLTRIKVLKLKINWSMKHKRFDIKESIFQQYILDQSQHKRHRNRGKYIHLYCRVWV